jgi:VacB/RNase II family 3'-5' exoribonuclease
MLDLTLIAKLQQVKDNIEASKERVQGVIKATHGRFGFVTLADRREIYLSATEMEKVLPGDVVNIIIHTAADGKTSAEIESLESSSLQFIIGQYQTRGQGHFVAPDTADNLRWIFIPPKSRGNAKPGDYIYCELKQHPFPSGKAQAHIIKNLGNAETIGVEADYAITRLHLPVDDVSEGLIEPDLSTRDDFSALALITIDSAEAADMDDALFAEVTDEGWRVVVAIADASAYIEPHSPVDVRARQRATSTYLPGRTLHMLPEKLATHSGSLMPGQLRAALLCEMSIAKNGEILAHQFKLGSVRSHAKLSYQSVSAHFEKNTAIDYPEVLAALCDASCALTQWREQHLLSSRDRADYRMILNAQGKIADCVLQEKTLAHRLVEECMIATNRCASEFLNGDEALYVQHPGFRAERLGDAKALARENLHDFDADPTTLDGYIALMRSAQALTHAAWPVASILSRWLNRASLSRTPAAHMGMGLPAYLTMTSPLRKYSDLFCHRLIKAKLQSETAPSLSDSELAEIIQGLDNSRRARQLMEQWLKAQYLSHKIGAPFLGTITHVNNNGLGVKLIDNGMDGQIDIKSLQQKYKFDARHLALVSDHKTLKLDDQVMIRVEASLIEQRSIQFKLNSE